jgi:CRISPR-associated exonuclease Cas4
MNITGTIVNYYFHCKRQCWLFANRINLEDNSEDVHIGKVLHELKVQEGNDKRELSVENIKLDKITKDYVIENKKSDADINAASWQLLYYLKILKDKGVYRKGRIEVEEKNKQDRKAHYIELTSEKEQELESVLKDIIILIESEDVPLYKFEQKCKKCAYFEYCCL